MKKVALVAFASVAASLAVVSAVSFWRENARVQAAMRNVPQSQRPLRVPAEKWLQLAFPNDTRFVLEQSEKLTLFSVNPSPGDYDEPVSALRRAMFHNHGVLRKTVVSGPAKSELLASFDDGLVPLSKNGLKQIAMCFNPRHGIRAVHGGKTVDLVICFECLQFEVYENGKPLKRAVPITDAPQPAFNRALAQASVRLAPKSPQPSA